MPCLFALLALVTPRLAIALLWFFTDFFAGVFDTALWLILGFLFLPTTLLWFVAVQPGSAASSSWSIIGIVIAIESTCRRPAAGGR
jgi:hypothetical protein